VAQRWQHPEGAPFAYDVAIRRLDDQLERISALDTKAGVLMAVDGVLIGLLLGADSLLLKAPLLVATGVIGLVVLSILLALFSFLNQRYQTAPEPAAAIRFMMAAQDWLKWRFLGNLESALETNDRKLRRKAWLLTAGTVILIAAVVLLGAYFVQAVVLGTLGGVHAS
jgi:hypothetical protein